MRAVMLLLAALLTVVPVSGFALCVAESGHVALELVGAGCEPAGDATCMTCNDCEDTPLSVGAAHRTASHAVTAPVIVAEAPVLVTPVDIPSKATKLPKNLSSRLPLLRC